MEIASQVLDERANHSRQNGNPFSLARTISPGLKLFEPFSALPFLLLPGMLARALAGRAIFLTGDEAGLSLSSMDAGAGSEGTVVDGFSAGGGAEEAGMISSVDINESYAVCFSDSLRSTEECEGSKVLTASAGEARCGTSGNTGRED